MSSPEDVVVLVDLLPHLGALQDAAVPDHGAAGAAGRVAATRPVVQHDAVGGRVEQRQCV